MLGLVNTPDGAVPVGIRELPEPIPALNEALVAVRTFSLNRGELALLRIRPAGWRPGQDIAGTVLEAAADGSGPKPGVRVLALLDWHGWAERAAVPVSRLAVLPDSVSFAHAAALPVAGITALRALRHGAPLLGKRVLITGAAGGVGNLAVQLGARSGARVTGVVGSSDRGAMVWSLGAQEVVDDIDQAQGTFPLILESVGRRSSTAPRRHWGFEQRRSGSPRSDAECCAGFCGRIASRQRPVAAMSPGRSLGQGSPRRAARGHRGHRQVRHPPARGWR
jgi:NADPH:quinone reductase